MIQESARKRIEEELRRTKEQVAEAQALAIVAASDDAIVAYSPDGEITSWNPGAERLFGYTEKEAIGRPIEMLLPPAAPARSRACSTAPGGAFRIEPFETQRVRKDGSIVDVSLSLPRCWAHTAGSRASRRSRGT